MKKNIILSVSLMFSMFLFSSTIVSATENSVPTLSVESSELLLKGTEPISPRATLRRYWTDGWLASGNPAPKLLYVNTGGFSGWLDKYKETPIKFGTQGVYRGYLYNNNYPIPSPTSLVINEDQNLELPGGLIHE